MTKHRRINGIHRGKPTPHKVDRPKRGRKVAGVTAFLVALGVAPAGAYTIKSGDTLWQIAQRHDTSVSRIVALNPRIDDPDVIYAGDRIRLARPDRSSNTRPRPAAVVAQHNHRPRRACTGPIPAAGSWHRHSGYPWASYSGDINISGSGDMGNPVRASRDGRVAEVHHWNTSYGNHVKLRHAAVDTLYAHMSQIFVTPGEHVERCEVIGQVGSSGNSSGPHLHYEVQP
jgi:murein DD-endopeptidase MepM/ murein hydrolase activator NlpD